MYRTAAPRVPDWEPPFWLRARNYARNFDWSALKPDPNSTAFTAAVLVFFMPVILVALALKVAWWVVRLAVRIVVGVVFLLLAGTASLFTSEPVHLEISWK